MPMLNKQPFAIPCEKVLYSHPCARRCLCTTALHTPLGRGGHSNLAPTELQSSSAGGTYIQTSGGADFHGFLDSLSPVEYTIDRQFLLNIRSNINHVPKLRPAADSR